MNPAPARWRIFTQDTVQRYRQRLSGPFLDRMDLVVQVQPTSREVLASAPPSEPTAVIRERIVRARRRQQARLRGTGWRTNAEIPARRGAMERLFIMTAGVARKPGMDREELLSINAGIVKIVYQSGYADSLSTEMLAEAQIELVKLDSSHTEVRR